MDDGSTPVRLRRALPTNLHAGDLLELEYTRVSDIPSSPSTRAGVKTPEALRSGLSPPERPSSECTVQVSMTVPPLQTSLYVGWPREHREEQHSCSRGLNLRVGSDVWFRSDNTVLGGLMHTNGPQGEEAVGEHRTKDRFRSIVGIDHNSSCVTLQAFLLAIGRSVARELP
ncbi:uncharacterized protein B0H18DRAFT_1101233 [Fomitopsis serialis]|uniref:uncharacterized protein n=1 Tax=Fomitopsis serialis TaxID=139415 RepID=UPI002007CE0A|nr:uncharacterized protein B0H18DRAFT_1101233 [Neoantrodia serialis]KAH9935481.1 hypothetical protein B0H18DRAFT_1101233 [Neoantrodia serialis]